MDWKWNLKKTRKKRRIASLLLKSIDLLRLGWFYFIRCWVLFFEASPQCHRRESLT